MGSTVTCLMPFRRVSTPGGEIRQVKPVTVTVFLRGERVVGDAIIVTGAAREAAKTALAGTSLARVADADPEASIIRISNLGRPVVE